jgi:hypothetical protein
MAYIDAANQVACPSCSVAADERCLTFRGTVADNTHMPRWRAYFAKQRAETITIGSEIVPESGTKYSARREGLIPITR